MAFERVSRCVATVCVFVGLSALSGCGGDGGADRPRADDHVVYTHVLEDELADAATGDYLEPALAYPPIPVDAKYTHALSFRMTPMMPPAREAVPSHGPLVLFSDDLDVLVFSPMDHFFVSLISFEDGAIHYGVEGEVESIPAGFSHRFILVEGQGIRATVERWGDLMRGDRGRDRIDRYADRGLSHLGYWTDNGAAYYYATEGDMNEAETLLAVKQDADARGIPLGYLQLDSWWYPKAPGHGLNPHGGVLEWQPIAAMFPDGGIDGFQEALGLPLVLHNRWFAVDNAYRDRYPFFEDERMSFPLEGGVFGEMMDGALPWEMVTYEQDWLMPQFHGVKWLRSGVDHADRWMRWMDEAARERGLTMQICMAGAAHLMDALDRPSVTTVRTSIDYKREVSKEAFWPAFHTVNMLAWALGIQPFKDNFRSSETHGAAEALVSALSAGMVGPSDALGKMDREILLRTCREDGLLLKPDRPALPLDAMFLPHERPYTTSTSSDRGDEGRWTYLAAYHLAREHADHSQASKLFNAVSYDDPVETTFVWPDHVTDWRLDLEGELGISEPVVAWSWRTGDAAVVEGTLELPERPDLYDWSLLVLAPIQDNGLALLGETGKYVTMADERFADVRVDGDALQVDLIGVPGEEVALRAFDADAGALLPAVTAVIGEDGTATARLARAGR